MFLVQPCQRVVEQPADFILFHQIFRRRLPPMAMNSGSESVFKCIGPVRRLFQGNGVKPFAFADDFERRMAGNAQHPGGKTRLTAKTFKIFQNAQKSLLRNITFGVLFLSQHPHGQPVNPLLIAVSQRLKSVQLARFGPAHQLGIKDVSCGNILVMSI